MVLTFSPVMYNSVCTIRMLFNLSRCTVFSGAIGTTGSYTEGSLPVHIIDLNCTGSELRVLDCPHNGLNGVHICDHRQDASVRCQGIIIL